MLRRLSFGMAMLVGFFFGAIPWPSCQAQAPYQPALTSTMDTPVPSMRLRLKNNAVAIGQIASTGVLDALAWQNEGFCEPFLFQLNSIRSITRSQALHHPVDSNLAYFQVETTDGEFLAGTISALDEQALALQTDFLGSLSIPRSRVASLTRIGQLGEVVYSGLLDEKAWSPVSSSKDWQFRAGTLQALRQGAAIVGDVHLPTQSEISLALTWKGVPDFTIYLGTLVSQRSLGTLPAAARIEIWNRNVVLVRETDRDADLTLLMVISDQNPQIELNILLDQEKGRVHVRDVYGQPLGSVHLPVENPQTRSAVHISNHGPALAVERLEVRRWDGVSLLSTEREHHIALRDGSSLQGHILGYSTELSEFTVSGENADEHQVAVDQVAFARLNKVPKTEPQPSKPQETSEIEVILSDHTRLRCSWIPGADGKIRFSSTSLGRDFEIEPQHLAGMIGNEQAYTFSSTKHPNGTLSTGQSELAGTLTVGESPNDGPTELETQATSLHWKPHGSQTSSTWRQDAEGQILFSQRLFPDHWPSPKLGEPTGRIAQSSTTEQADVVGEAPNGTPQASQRALPQVTRQIHFLSGDTIDGYVEKIDASGVHFRSNQTEIRLVEHSRMNNLWLNALLAASKKPPEDKLQRLMIVPRMMKDDPPTHLLLSVSGDWLRCRLLELNEAMATAEIRREVLQIPRDQISQIVWLHQRQWTTGDDTQVAMGSPNPPGAVPSELSATTSDRRIHVIQDERGITFVPHRLKDDELCGTSELLGQCCINLRGVHRILFGPRLDQRIVESKANPWVLTLAPKPRTDAQESTSEIAAQQSPLVGQPAPSFVLTCLDGQTAQLSNMLGKIVVLDFWASWCDPCAKSLPMVQEVVAEFESSQVGLLTVNIQEAEPRVQAAVEQWDLSFPVALDKDGRIAARYLATAIPQTVVIDPRGIIRYVFTVGGTRFPEELKQAIQTLVRSDG